MSNYNTMVELESDEVSPLPAAELNEDAPKKTWSRIVVVLCAIVGVILMVFKTTNMSLDRKSRLQVRGDAGHVIFIEAKQFQSDKGSGAKKDLFVYRAKEDPPKGCFRVATVAVNHHPDSVFVPCLCGKEGTDVKKPTKYKKIYTDAGSGKWYDYSLWNPVCPSGFVSLSGTPWLRKAGHTGALWWSKCNGNCRKNLPFQGVYCVAIKYVMARYISDQIWNDHGTGARQDGSVWQIADKYGAFGGWIASGNHNKPIGPENGGNWGYALDYSKVPLAGSPPMEMQEKMKQNNAVYEEMLARANS